MVDDRIQIDVNEGDCRIDTYRASGAGGQHVNKTESAVRITHMPTGIVVACQSERSQHKNRATAWNMLRARLYERELELREAKVTADAASKTDIGWGHQIRSYVLQPYQMVKDLRTGHVSGTPSEVLDGDLDPFMEASLAQTPVRAGRWWSRTWSRRPSFARSRGEGWAAGQGERTLIAAVQPSRGAPARPAAALARSPCFQGAKRAKLSQISIFVHSINVQVAGAMFAGYTRPLRKKSSTSRKVHTSRKPGVSTRPLAVGGSIGTSFAGSRATARR